MEIDNLLAITSLVVAMLFYMVISLFEGAFSFRLRSISQGNLGDKEKQTIGLKMQELSLITFIRLLSFVAFTFFVVALSLNRFNNLWVTLGCVSLFLILLFAFRAVLLRVGVKYS